MSLRVNPVLGRELRERMRNGRSFWVLGVFLGLLVLAAYLVIEANASINSFDLARLTRVGRTLFEVVVLVMLLLVFFFVPGLTAAAFAGERERQTLQPMQITLLRPHQLLVGKVLASMSFIGLLIVSALPMLVAAYLLGGVTVTDGLAGLGIVALLGVLLTTMVAAVSARARRVQSATLTAYGLTLLILVASPVAFLIIRTVDQSTGNDPVRVPSIVGLLNPVTIAADAVGSPAGGSADAPLSALKHAMITAWQDDGGHWAWWPSDDQDRSDRTDPFPGWLLGSLVAGGVTALGAWRGVRALRTPAEAER